MLENVRKHPKTSENTPKNPKYLKIPQNNPKYVLQDYRGIGGRAPLPPKPEAYKWVLLSIAVHVDIVTRGWRARERTQFTYFKRLSYVSRIIRYSFRWLRYHPANNPDLGLRST